LAFPAERERKILEPPHFAVALVRNEPYAPDAFGFIFLYEQS
jgi:hypothetical protein